VRRSLWTAVSTSLTHLKFRKVEDAFTEWTFRQKILKRGELAHSHLSLETSAAVSDVSFPPLMTTTAAGTDGLGEEKNSRSPPRRVTLQVVSEEENLLPL